MQPLHCTNIMITSLRLRVCYLESVQLEDISVLECIQRNTTRACPTLIARYLSYHD